MTIKFRTVLLVDDDPDDQLLVREIIKSIDPNFQIASAYNGVEALEFLQHLKKSAELPCLVILDINMPVMDGKQTLAQLKKDPEFNIVPVVLFTTSSSPLDRTFADQYGAKFVTKPIRQQELFNTVKTLLEFCSK